MKATEVKLTYQRKATGIKICQSKDAEEVFRNFWDEDTMDYYESFMVIFLSRANDVLGVMKVTEGGLDACIVDTRKIFQGALLTNSASIIVSHNHPSGNLKASQPDMKVTKDLKEAGEFLKIRLLDHLILTSSSYMSMADEGML